MAARKPRCKNGPRTKKGTCPKKRKTVRRSRKSRR